MSIGLFGGRMGVGEVVVILAIVLLLFGARKIPDLARSIGRGLEEFKKGRREASDRSDTPDDRAR